MSKLKELIAQQEALNIQIEELRKQERSEGISKAMALISEYQLTQQDLFGAVPGAAKVKAVSKVAAKYRDPKSGKEWSGRGLAPKWIKGLTEQERERFLIQPEKQTT